MNARTVIFGLTAAAFALGAQTAGASWIDTWLNLDHNAEGIRWSDEQTRLVLRHALPAWAWVLIVLSLGGAAALSYSRMAGPRAGRVALAALRTLLLVFLAVLLARPALQRVDEINEPDELVVLVDRSASMQTPDMPGRGETVSRDAALRQAWLTHASTFGPEGLALEGRLIRRLGFGRNTFELSDDPQAWPDPEEPSTALSTALEQALSGAAGRPLAGIIIPTDGRSTQPIDPNVLRRLTEQQVRVYPVPLGALTMPMDLELREVQAPSVAYQGDLVPVRVTVDQVGLETGEVEAVDPDRVKVIIEDRATGQALAERTLADGEVGQAVVLPVQAEALGEVDWQVRVELTPDPLDPADLTGFPGGELTLANNNRELKLRLTDEPIRLLYVEGYPRWEYRYLKNMFIREDSIDSSMLLRTADRAFVQEGNTPIVRAPNTDDEIQAFDVVVLGDVGPDYFTGDQLRLLRRHVASGGGLLWIGGQRSTPRRYAETPLSDILPMLSPGRVSPLSLGNDPYTLSPSDTAERLGVMRLRSPFGSLGDDAAQQVGWPRDLPPLYWGQRLGRLKPTAEVLASTPDLLDGDPPAPVPIVTRMRFGSGEVIYVATDETWRWRRGLGESYFEQFWIQLVRQLGRTRLQEGGQRARLVVEPPRLEVGQTATVRLFVDDASLAEQLGGTVEVRLQASDSRDAAPQAPQGDPAAQDAAGADSLSATLTLRRVLDGPRAGRVVYESAWKPILPGETRLAATDARLSELGLEALASTRAPDDETRNPRADPDRLERLAEATGGQVVGLDELPSLTRLVRDLSQTTAQISTRDVWNTPLALLIFLSLITVEWLGRKLMQLV